MKKKVFTYLSIVTLLLGAAAGGYVLISSLILRASLPAGVCPVVQNKPLIYAAIALCLSSFVFTLFEQRAKKRDKAEEPPHE